MAITVQESFFMTKQLHTVRGKRGTLSELVDYFRVVDLSIARERILRRGWNLERAITEPKHKEKAR